MHRGHLAGPFVLLAALAGPAAPAFGQQNPATRGADATPRFALQARLAGPVVEHLASAASPFPDACGDRSGTLHIGAEVEPHIAADPLNPDHLIGAWQQDRYANGGARGQVSAVSFDGGATWTRAAMPVSVCAGAEYARATDPWVSFAPDGSAYQIALGISGELNTPGSVSAVLVFRSADGGVTWDGPATIARDTGSLFDDKETITADPTDVRYAYAVWDRLDGTNGSASVFTRTTDGGATWEPAREIYRPAGGGETIGNLVRVLPDGTLVNAFMHLDPRATPTIYVMRSGDKGATWSTPLLVSTAQALGSTDPDTGMVIRDAAILPEMAVAPDGTLCMVWQDARFTQQRDAIAFSSSKDGGLTWSQPVRVNSHPGVAAFIPQVHVRSDGTIGVTYYDLRSNTPDPATLPADFWLARSSDGGLNWTETRVSPAFDLSTAPFANGLFLGDYTGLASSGASFIALYAKTTGDLANRNDVYAARIGDPAGAEAKRAGYAAQALPEGEPDAAFRERVNRNAARAMQARYLNVQRYTASIPGR